MFAERPEQKRPLEYDHPRILPGSPIFPHIALIRNYQREQKNHFYTCLLVNPLKHTKKGSVTRSLFV